MITNIISACENGTFGKDCVHKCEGHCLNDEPCNKTDGECSRCSSGWAGEFCNISKMSVFYFEHKVFKFFEELKINFLK